VNGDSSGFRRVATAVAIGILVILDVALVFLYFQKDDSGSTPAQASASASSTTSSDPTTSSGPTTSSPPATPSPPATSSLPKPTRSSSTSAPPSTSSPPPQMAPLTAVALTKVAKPYQTVRLTGQFVKSHSVLRVQELRHTTWTTFPLPAMTDASGRYNAYVELAKRGQHELRVVSTETGAESNVVTVTVR
jgi:cytoskeletal protein RodZ